MLGAPSISSRWHLNTPVGLRDRGATLDISKSCSRTGSVSAHSAPPLATGSVSVEPPEGWGPRRLLITRLLSLGAVEEHIVAGRGVLVITGAAPIVRARCADMAHGGCARIRPRLRVDGAPGSHGLEASSARRWRIPRGWRCSAAIALAIRAAEMSIPHDSRAAVRRLGGRSGPYPQARSRSRCPATSSARLNGPRVTGPAQESGQQPQKSRRRRHNVLPRIGSMAAGARPQPFAPMRRKRIYPHWIKAELLNDIGSRLRRRKAEIVTARVMIRKSRRPRERSPIGSIPLPRAGAVATARA